MPKTATQEAHVEAVGSNLNVAWIGLKGNTAEKQWKWEDGTQLSGWNDWSNGVPEVTGDCIRIVNGHWNTVPCWYGSKYVCQVSLPVAQVQCQNPTTPGDATVVSTNTAPYRVGDKVTYKCKTSEKTTTIICQPQGQWTTVPLNKVCEVCPTGWKYTHETESCYKAFSQSVSYSVASGNCKEKGGLLAMPKTSIQQAAVQDVSAGMNVVYIGLYGDQTAAVWKWEDGTKLSGWTNWPGEPPAVSGGQCVRVWSSRWYNVPCWYGSAYACQVPLTIASVACPDPPTFVDGTVVSTNTGPYRVGDKVTYKCKTSEESKTIKCLSTGQWTTLIKNRVCEICSGGWKYNHETDSCYKGFSESVGFDTAKGKCEAEGGTLAMPKTSGQFETVKAVSTGLNVVWIGLKGVESVGHWQWIDGTKLSGWSQWPGDEPAISGTRCVRIWSQKWYNTPCWWGSYFACQKPYKETP